MYNFNNLEFISFVSYFIIIWILIKAVKPGCTIAVSDDDLLNISTGKLNMMTVS